MKVQLMDRYTDLPEDWKEGLIEECCGQEDRPDDHVADCCYRDWNLKLRSVNARYKGISEVVRLKEMELQTVTGKRDRLKSWVEELSTADELVHQVCNQLEHLKCQVRDISQSTDHTADAVLLLFCMIRDIYGQIDRIKKRYDDILKCIECLDDPIFVEGEGLLKCLKEYYATLEVIIKTRDALMALIIKAMDLSNQLYNNMGADYGLNNVLRYWKWIFKCKRPHREDENEEAEKEDARQEQKSQQGPEHHQPHHHDDCVIEPSFDMPFCDNPYYTDIKSEYEDLVTVVDDLKDELARMKEEQERLLSCKVSLEKAKDLVDPKARCN